MSRIPPGNPQRMLFSFQPRLLACSSNRSSSASGSNSSVTSSPSSSSFLCFLLAFFVLFCFTIRSRFAKTAVLQFSGSCCSSSQSASISRALFRFFSCDREYWHVTTFPVGRWVSCTLELVLLIFWPPGPRPPFMNSSLISSSLISHKGRGGSLVFLGIAARRVRMEKFRSME